MKRVGIGGVKLLLGGAFVGESFILGRFWWNKRRRCECDRGRVDADGFDERGEKRVE